MLVAGASWSTAFAPPAGVLKNYTTMLTPGLNHSCADCANIPTLVEEIDCKLARLAGHLYYNTTLMLNHPVPSTGIIDLLTYRRILFHKHVNPSYLEEFTVQDIADKVKLLLNK